MLDGMKMATQGMLAMMAKQDIIANNLANVGTSGYRKDILTVSSFSDVLNQEMANEGGFVQAGGSEMTSEAMLMTSSATSTAQGALKETGNTFDLALDDNGKGLFSIQSRDGIKYTRTGSFRLSTDGHIVTADGSFLLGQKGALKVNGSNFAVSNEGVVSVDGKEIDKLLVTTFDENKGMSKAGDNNFVASTGGRISTESRVKQGYLEMSNVNAVKEMVDMMTVMRAYEANQKVLQAEDHMLQKSNEVGKVR